MHMKKATKCVGKKRISYKMNQISHTGNASKQPTWFWGDISPIWTAITAAVEASVDYSENCASNAGAIETICVFIVLNLF
jgi:hypothetical protein